MDRAAFGELVAAGLMEPDGRGDYRFAEEDGTRREEILHAEEERIEQARFEPPDVRNLSGAARDLLRRLVVDRERVEVTFETKPAYRELASARIMYPLSGFIGGPESAFRFTYWGWHRRLEWISDPAAAPPAESS